MKKSIVSGLILILGLGLGVSRAQVTPISGSEIPLIIEAAGAYEFGWPDTLFVNYERALDAADSAKVDSCRLTKNLSIFQLNGNDITLDGLGKVIYGPGGTDVAAGSFHDVQGIWPNRIYGDTTAFDNIRISDVTVMLTNNAVYLTKVSNSLVEGVTIKYASRGIYIQSRSSGSASDGVGGEFAVADTIRGCTLIDVYKEAIPVRGPGHQILNNTLIYTDTTYSEGYSKSVGISIQRSTQYLTTGILVKGNIINGGSFLNTGIKADRAGFNTYADNTINNVLLNGVWFDGHASNGLSDENVFTNTAINLAGVDSANGIYFYDLADNNVFDGLTIDSAGVAIKAIDNCRGNTIKNGVIDGSSITDVDVSGNTSVFLVNTPFDTANAIVEPGSAIFFGEGFEVSFKVESPWDVPTVGDTVLVWNRLGDLVGSFITDATSVATFKLAEEGISASADTMIWGAQNPYKFEVRAGDLYASYDHELTVTLTADTTFAIDMDIVWEPPPVNVVTSEEYTFETAKDTLMVNYLWAADSTDSAAVAEIINHCRETANLSIIQLNADNITFDGNDQVIYGAGGTDPVAGKYHDVQGIWPNRIYSDTSEFNNITIKDVTIAWANIAIYMTEVRNGLVENCTILDSYRGIYPNSKLNSDASGCIVQDNTLTNINREAIPVRGPGHKVLNNTISADRELNSKSTGIYLARSIEYETVGNLVQGNTINGNSYLQRGIHCNRSGSNTYRQNTINAVAGYGLYFDSHATTGRGDENTFIQTEINLAGADSAVGIYFSDASYNVIDTVIVDSAGTAILATNGSRGNVISHAVITASSEYDVVVEGGSSVLVTTLANIDTSKVSVEQGSAIYFGTDQLVDLEVLLDNSLPLPGIDVIVTNAGGDTVGSFVTDEDGIVSVDVAAKGITFSGYSDAQNPFTLSAVHNLDDGTSALIGSVTATVTKDTAITLSISYLGLAAGEADLPTEFALSQNYPNPFNPSTTIRYALPEDANVRLRVYDIAGRLVKTLIQGTQNAGYYYVMWDGTDNAGKATASGIYIYELVAGDFRQVDKMIFLK